VEAPPGALLPAQPVILIDVGDNSFAGTGFKGGIIMKTWTYLVLVLLLGFASAASAGTPASQTTLCSDQSLEAIFAANGQAPAPSDVFFVTQGAPVCNPLCVTSQCTSNADCTAAPQGRCNFACPQTGCCVYPE
jgi:hypothetical protein